MTYQNNNSAVFTDEQLDTISMMANDTIIMAGIVLESKLPESEFITVNTKRARAFNVLHKLKLIKGFNGQA